MNSAPLKNQICTIIIMRDGTEVCRIHTMRIQAAKNRAVSAMRRYSAQTAMVFVSTTPHLGTLRWSYERKGYLAPRLNGQPHDPFFLEAFSPQKSGWVRV